MLIKSLSATIQISKNVISTSHTDRVLSFMSKIQEILVRSRFGKVVHIGRLDRLDRPDSNLPFHFGSNLFIALLLFSRFHLRREFGKGIQNGKSYSSPLSRFGQKCRSIFPWVVELVSDRRESTHKHSLWEYLDNRGPNPLGNNSYLYIET